MCIRDSIVCAICLIKLLLLPLYHVTRKYDAKGNNPHITCLLYTSRAYLYRHIATPNCADGLYIPRKNYFMGQFLHAHYPEDVYKRQLDNRATVKATYEQAINDLKQAEKLMTIDKGPAYASKEAAQALLSRVYLYMSGTYENPNREYAKLAVEDVYKRQTLH